MAVCRHPLLHADYLMWKEAAARNQPQSSKAASAGPLRRLSNRKDVMARNAGTFTEVRALIPPLIGGSSLAYLIKYMGREAGGYLLIMYMSCTIRG